MTIQQTRGKGNQVQRRKNEKKKTLADSNYFYTEESIPCTSFYVHVTVFACTLHT